MRTVTGRRAPSPVGVSAASLLATLVASTACGSGAPGPSGCNPGDQNGIIGQTYAILVTVTDTAFTVGALDGGPGEPNIAVENLSTVTLTVTNAGSRPHDFVVQCMPTPNANGCPLESCFPSAANVSALAPGASAKTTFMTPAAEGAYPFLSDLLGDMQRSADGGAGGLVGEFVLM